MMRDLITEADAEALIAGAQPAWLFKHSRTCPVSQAAFDRVLAWLAAHPGERAGMLVVQDQRPLSNWVAQRLGRVHQSPQLFLVAGGKVLWDASHWSITGEAMDAARGRHPG